MASLAEAAAQLRAQWCESLVAQHALSSSTIDICVQTFENELTQTSAIYTVS